ncbi:hypothetical protein [Gracilibacillus dipsosauri]|uniref:Uncharacterized protein n=1 Tax=Gracilibacillus dipsosauri TaxID=178340 RepID=A0A317L173_9BACI|nr:hypothetical protein [Gracilibacillus dipsosauri]PWU69024.1 hypothetical protein DLJ74_11480 [Gracilibacillus dipsosauri]
MKKKPLIVIILFIAIGLIITIFLIRGSEASLVETVQIKEQYQDFIIHIRVEDTEDGFQVLRSLEYIGDEMVEIKHRTPLTQITIDKDNAVFTGSHRNMVLRPGNQYNPLEPLHLENLEKGSHRLYIHTQFMMEGKWINIKTEKEILFE